MEVHYKAQVRFSLEYACLACGGAANKHLTLLYRVQERAAKLIREAGHQPALRTFQQRRGVAGLTVMVKVQQQIVPHLQQFVHTYVG